MKITVSVIDTGTSNLPVGHILDIDEPSEWFDKYIPSEGVSMFLDASEYDTFKALYREARDNGSEIFMFKGRKILCGYAKYVCKYVDSCESRYNN